MLELLTNPEVWISLSMLTFMEIVLGIDNIIFITIAANKLDDKEQDKATNIGLILAMVMRILLLFGISYLIAMSAPLFHIDTSFAHGGFSGQSLILIAGGLFLLYKSTSEIHHKLEGATVEEEIAAQNKKGGKATLGSVIFQICLINIVFSFDSILTAVGMTNGVEGALPIMITAVILSIGVMMLFAGPVGRFVNKHPSVQMLGMAFLILIGFMLIMEGAHLAHFEAFGQKVGAIPKGYLYFAIFFSLCVEALNMRLRKVHKPVKFKQQMTEEAVRKS